jgi:hypothetical protein
MRIGRLLASQARLAPMRLAGCSQCVTCGRSPRFASIPDVVPFHLRDLREDGEDQLAGPFGDESQPEHVDNDALADQPSNARLDVDCVTAEPIDRIDRRRATNGASCRTPRALIIAANSLAYAGSAETCPSLP